MKYVLMNSSGNLKNMKMQTIIPGDKEKEKKENSNNENTVETEEKEVDAAQFNIPDTEFSRDLKTRTDDALKKYMHSDSPIPLSYNLFDKDMNTIVANALNEQDARNKKDKISKRAERLKALKNKLFKRRNNG